jgi:mono/diheme cytochrome c family protein
MILWLAIPALSALLAASPAPGGLPAAPAAEPKSSRAQVTYARDVAPILFKSCVSCHRPGNIAPVSLLTYEDARRNADLMADVTRIRFMPPWHADSHGEFANERKLTPEEIETIREWAVSGTAEGDKKDLPKLPEFPEGWQLGTPDCVLKPAQAYTVPAEGPDEYRYYVLPTNFGSDRWLSAIEYRPGNMRVTHHIIAFADSSGAARRRSDRAGGAAYAESGDGIGFIPTAVLGGWAPGNLPEALPPGVGLLLPKGADIVLQVHYHKDGKPEQDLPSIGLHFCSSAVDKRLRILPLFAPIDIPPGDPDYVAHAIPYLAFDDMTVIDVMPHMHYLGKEMTIRARLPDGTVRQLIHVPRWDFNWQTTYRYKSFVKLPAGSLLGMNAHFDNSKDNPKNPNSPPREVKFGEATTDEMCLGFLWFTYDRESLTQGKSVADLTDTLTDAARKLGDFLDSIRKSLNFDFD